MLQGLPLLAPGRQSFAMFRENNWLYVDKTKYLAAMIQRPGIYFYARPRRFGKTLTCTTFRAMFEGKKHLFKGLAAEQFVASLDTAPVIYLAMHTLDTGGGMDNLQKSLNYKIITIARELDVKIREDLAPGDAFNELITLTVKKYGKPAVLLIDEYDKPFTDFIFDHEKAEEVRNFLRSFYIQIKASEEYLRFIFITGVAKYTKVGVFSTLNNLEDISMNTEFGTICGITDEELRQYFMPYMEERAKQFDLSVAEFIEQMETCYDGFCFDGVHRLYNPYSTLLFLRDESNLSNFKNYWMDSGGQSVVQKYLKDKNLTVEQFRMFPIEESLLKNPGEIELTPPELFFYQTGYLTLRAGEAKDYALDYPNAEVLNAMSRLLAENILNRPGNPHNYAYLSDLLINGITYKNPADIVDAFNMLLASIPYEDYDQAAQITVRRKMYKYPAQEWLYRSNILSFVKGCGVAAAGEMHSNCGKADLVMRSRNHNYFVVEFKVAYKGEDCRRQAEAAMRQINDNNYAAPYPNATRLALAIDNETRQIASYKVE